MRSRPGPKGHGGNNHDKPNSGGAHRCVFYAFEQERFLSPVTIVQTPDVAEFTREDFDRAWQLDVDAPRHARVTPETAIVLQRNSPHDFQDRQIYVYVDGENIGKIRYGQTFSHPIEPGEHSVRVFNTLMSQTITIKAAPGEQVRLQCGNGMPRAGWLMMIFLHVTYLRCWITRDEAP